MKIISWNVNGIRACAKKGLLDFVEREDPHILCLQETKAHPDQLGDELLHLDGYDSYWSSAYRQGYSGTAIYTKKQPKDTATGLGIRKFDHEGRMVVCDFDKFILYNVYFPNGASSGERHDYKQEFLERFRRHLKSQMDQGREIVVVGDYNVAYLEIDVHDPQGLAETSGFLPEEREWFQRFLETGFVDSFRKFHENEKHRYSWWSYREKARQGNRGWRIDHICVTKGLSKNLVSADLLDHQLGSDHCPVVAELKI